MEIAPITASTKQSIGENGMNEELLKEFWISEGEGVYTIQATDRAYELLGLKNKVKKAKNPHPHEIRLLDTIDSWYYRYAFLSFLSHQYQIDGLYRVSRGNSHDANLVKELTIIHGGGGWKDEFVIDTKMSDWTEYVVNRKKSISKDLFKRWSKEFDLSGYGEVERFVFCSYGSEIDGKMVFKFANRFLLGPANERMFRYKATAKDAVISSVCLKKLSVDEMEYCCEEFLR